MVLVVINCNHQSTKIIFLVFTESLTICSKETYTSDGNLTFTITSFSVYSSEETPVESPSPVDNGGNFGSGGGTVILQAIDFNINPESYEKTVVLDRIEFGEITITNKENSNKTFNIKVEVLEDIIFFEETNVKISPEETKILEFRIIPPRETGIYTGKIIITSGSTKKEILVTINVKTEKSLFDIILSISKTIGYGKNLKAKIDLLQVGIKEEIDVTLKYIIKDFNGKVYLTESETIAILDQKLLSKEFYTQELPPGNYVFGVELIYPDGVAVASSQFKVKEKFEIGKKEMLFAALISILALIFIIALLTIKRKVRKRKSKIKNKIKGKTLKKKKK